jgi:cytosine deaminase
VPIGAALVVDGKVLGGGHNRRVQQGSAIRHGEMDCLENIGRLPASVYARATMYTTLSPCPMCSGAVLLYKIPRVVLAENATFLGAEDHLRANGVEVVNLDLDEAKKLMAR